MEKTIYLYFFPKFVELESGLLFDKRIGPSCAPLILSNGTRVAVIVGGKSSESSAQQTSYQLAQMEVFNPTTNSWILLNQPVPVFSEFVSFLFATCSEDAKRSPLKSSVLHLSVL